MHGPLDGGFSRQTVREDAGLNLENRRKSEGLLPWPAWQECSQEVHLHFFVAYKSVTVNLKVERKCG